MVKQNNHQIRNTIIGGLILAAIISLILYFIPNGWQSIFSFIGSVFKWLFSITEMPNWALIIFALIVLLLFTGLFLKIYLFRKPNNSPYRLTELTVFEILWRWHPSHDGNIHELVSFCPKCDFQIYTRTGIIGHPPRSVYHCEDCDRDVAVFNTSQSEVENRVKRKIQQHLRRKLRETNDALVT